jgi:hypothetical protein
MFLDRQMPAPWEILGPCLDDELADDLGSRLVEMLDEVLQLA